MAMFLLNSPKMKLALVNNRQMSSFVLPGLTSLEKKYVEEQTELVLNPPKLEEELAANDHIPFIPNDHQSLYAYKRRINALQLANISNKKFWSNNISAAVFLSELFTPLEKRKAGWENYVVKNNKLNLQQMEDLHKKTLETVKLLNFDACFVFTTPDEMSIRRAACFNVHIKILKQWKRFQ